MGMFSERITVISELRVRVSPHEVSPNVPAGGIRFLNF